MYVRTVDSKEESLSILFFPPVPNINCGWRQLNDAYDNIEGIDIHVMLWYMPVRSA